MAEKLTPQQETAVSNRGGKLLVSAAAGSGKTKVLVDRLLSYLTDPIDPANIDDFLIITYTKAAASELRAKIAAKLSERIAQNGENRHLQRQLQRLYLTKISTVHAFCSDLLKEHAYRLDIPADFRVGDENECRELRYRVLEQILDDAYGAEIPDPDFLAFVDTQGLGRNDSLVPDVVLKVYDSARCHLDPDAWLNKSLAASDVSDVSDASQTLWGRYLMDDLFRFLDMQIESLSCCLKRLEAVPELGKCAALLRDTAYQLQHLRSSSTWDEVYERRTIDFGRLTFPRKYDDPELAEAVKAVRSACKDGLESKLRSFSDCSADILQDLGKTAPAVRGMIMLVNAFSDNYDRLKRIHRILDFGDLEHRTLDLLLGKSRSGITSAAYETARRFREIMVDEYQDSNAVQDAIFDALTRERQNLFMVGDAKQSIYQFRLADPGIFLEKYASYESAAEAAVGQGRKVMLSSNFRSCGAVVDAVNHVFTACMSQRVGGLTYGEEEMLREGIPHASLSEPEIELHAIEVQEDTYAEEAAFVAHRIVQLTDGTHMIRQGDGERPITPGDIVILLRSPGSVGGQFRYALEQCGVRCSTGGDIDLLQTEEVGTLRSLLQTISNPRQDIPLLATLTSPIFCFSADELAAIRARNKRISVYDALCRDESRKSKDTVGVLRALRQEARMRTLSQLLEHIILCTHLDSIYGAMPGGNARRTNIQSFLKLAAEFEGRGGHDMQQFLSHLDLMEEDGLVVSSDQSDSDCVTIMSIHKSKGLEFPVVFLCGLARRFNRQSLNAQVLCDKEMGLGVSCVDTEKRVRYPCISKRAIAVKAISDSLSEELRVLYVAMTRPRDRLIMTYASNTLANDLRDIALRMDLSSRELLTGSVSCPGEWVLLAALQKTEAGALFSLGGKPKHTMVLPNPWKITVSQAPQKEAAAMLASLDAQILSQSMLDALTAAQKFTYAYQSATQTPSKQTATQRKGRYKDQEAAENSAPPRHMEFAWRKPGFVEQTMDATEYGSAIHAVLQYIDYRACADEASVCKEVERLCADGFISAEQAKAVDCQKISCFFRSDLGVKLRSSESVLREFKFSILDDAQEYTQELEGEQVLLQGVVDCALIEPDGITIIDFKTDYVTQQTVMTKAEHYRPQVAAYAEALCRIYGMPVKEMLLYFFCLDRFVSL